MLKADDEPPATDLRLFDMLAGVLHELDPEGVPIPMLLPAVTDARHFARLGIQTYGFMPLRLPTDFPMHLAHAADERVPIDAVEFGAEALFRAIERYPG